MAEPHPPAVEEADPRPGPGRSHGPDSRGPGARPPLAQKALSEAYARLRFRDTSLLIWQQQQLQLQTAPPSTYLSRSQSAWHCANGNQAVLVRDNRALEESQGQSRICSLM